MSIEKHNEPHKEQELTSYLLARVTPLPMMEWPVLKVMWEKRLLPMSPMECVIVDKDPFQTPVEDLKILLSYRDDAHFPDCWHHPGSYLGSGDKIAEAVQRTIEKEIKSDVAEFWPVTMANFYKLARDHEFSYLHVCRLSGEVVIVPGKLEFLPALRPPANLLPHHKLMQERVVEWLMVMKELSPSHREMVLRVTRYLEAPLSK